MEGRKSSRRCVVFIVNILMHLTHLLVLVVITIEASKRPTLSKSTRALLTLTGEWTIIIVPGEEILRSYI